MNTDATLVCPKCGGYMRTYERSGLLVDQCTECRGIFLDRGELERLIDAEGTANSPDSRPAEPMVSRELDRGARVQSDDSSDAHRLPAGKERGKESRFGGLMDLFGGD